MVQPVSDLKPFIGARNYAESRDFYLALGWQLNFDTGELAELDLDGNRFLLQRFYQADWCNNTMLHLTVASADSWFDRVSRVLAAGDYGAARAQAPQQQDYGARVTFMWDPSGVLWHLAQPVNPGERE